MKRRVFFIVCILLIGISPLFAQEVSEKKEIAVFGLSYYDWEIPSGALGSIDAQIKDVFVNIGRFTVIGMTYRLEQSDVQAFIEKIKEYKSTNVEIPEEVSLGQEAFTEADFNKLVGSFLVVIPSVTYYNLEADEDGEGFTATLETDFTFIDVEKLETVAHITIETTGYDEDSKAAIKDAADAISSRLTYEIRSLEPFQIKTGIVEILNRKNVHIQLGKDMGIMVGDEYAVVDSTVTGAGYEMTQETGLLMMRDVQPEFSIAEIVYSQKPLVVGDQLKEIARMGFEAALYANVISSADSLIPVAGLKGAYTRGFYKFRPIVGLEVPFRGLSGGVSDYFPVNTYAGGELNLFMGRLRLTPWAGVALGMLIETEDDENDEDDYYVSHIGGKGLVTASYLLSRDIMVYGEAGYTFMFGLQEEYSSFFGSYSGILFGAGLTFKL